MWYSNDEPTPTKFRRRTYAIACDNDLTQEDFNNQYKWPIRRANSQHPDCKFLIMAVNNVDKRVEEYLRKGLGVSPARITIYYLAHRVPENKYRSATLKYDNILVLENDFVLYSSHDIIWIPPYVPDGMTSRIKMKRDKKQQTNPFVEVIYDAA